MIIMLAMCSLVTKLEENYLVRNPDKWSSLMSDMRYVSPMVTQDDCWKLQIDLRWNCYSFNSCTTGLNPMRLSPDNNFLSLTFGRIMDPHCKAVRF